MIHRISKRAVDLANLAIAQGEESGEFWAVLGKWCVARLPVDQRGAIKNAHAQFCKIDGIGKLGAWELVVKGAMASAAFRPYIDSAGRLRDKNERIDRHTPQPCTIGEIAAYVAHGFDQALAKA